MGIDKYSGELNENGEPSGYGKIIKNTSSRTTSKVYGNILSTNGVFVGEFKDGKISKGAALNYNPYPSKIGIFGTNSNGNIIIKEEKPLSELKIKNKDLLEMEIKEFEERKRKFMMMKNKNSLRNRLHILNTNTNNNIINRNNTHLKRKLLPPINRASILRK